MEGIPKSGGHDRTFAELGYGVKHAISHRAVALRRFRELLLPLLKRPRST